MNILDFPKSYQQWVSKQCAFFAKLRHWPMNIQCTKNTIYEHWHNVHKKYQCLCDMYGLNMSSALADSIRRIRL